MGAKYTWTNSWLTLYVCADVATCVAVQIDLKLNGSEEQPQRAKAAPAAVQQRQQQTVDPELGT